MAPRKEKDMTSINRIYYFNMDIQSSALLEQKKEKSFSSVRSNKVKQIRGNCVIDIADGPGI